MAAALLDVLEQTARQDGMKQPYVEASETARRFFLKRGYAVERRRDSKIRSVAIHNYAMTPDL